MGLTAVPVRQGRAAVVIMAMRRPGSRRSLRPRGLISAPRVPSRTLCATATAPGPLWSWTHPCWLHAWRAAPRPHPWSPPTCAPGQLRQVYVQAVAVLAVATWSPVVWCRRCAARRGTQMGTAEIPAGVPPGAGRLSARLELDQGELAETVRRLKSAVQALLSSDTRWARLASVKARGGIRTQVTVEVFLYAHRGRQQGKQEQERSVSSYAGKRTSIALQCCSVCLCLPVVLSGSCAAGSCTRAVT